MSASFCFPRLLCAGIVQGVILGGLAGALLACGLWSHSTTQQFQSECPCPSPRVCVPAVPVYCANLTSDHFMLADPEVESFYNKRIVPVQGLLSPEECQWIVEASGAERAAPDTALVIPRNSRSWAWVYDRIHGKVLGLNKDFWHFTAPADYHSELVEDILLVVKTNVSSMSPGYTSDLATVGSSGKRVLSGVMMLNTAFEGGPISTLPDQQDASFELSPQQGLLWLLRSFTLKKQLPVISGRQYMLYYWLRRY